MRTVVSVSGWLLLLYGAIAARTAVASGVIYEDNGSLVIRYGSTFENEKGEHVITNCHLDSIYDAVYRSRKTRLPFEAKRSGTVILSGRKANWSVSMQAQIVGTPGWQSNAPMIDECSATYSISPDETVRVIATPEGHETEWMNSHLATLNYEGVYYWKMDLSGLPDPVLRDGVISITTADGPLYIGRAIATASSDTSYGATGMYKAGGKWYVTETFPMGEVEQLAQEHGWVKIDPVVMLQPYFGNDCFMVQEAPFDTQMFGGYPYLYMGYTGTYHWRSVIVFTGMPVGEYISVTLQVTSAGYSSGSSQACGVYLLRGRESKFDCGSALGWTYQAGKNCWKYRVARTDPWPDQLGAMNYKRIVTFTPGAAGTVHSIALPASLIRPGDAFLLRSESESVSNTPLLWASEAAVLENRPALIIQYTSDIPHNVLGGGFAR